MKHKPQKPSRPAPVLSNFSHARLIYEHRLALSRKEIAAAEKRAARRSTRTAELARLRFAQQLLDAAERIRTNGGTLEQAREQLRSKLNTRLAQGEGEDAYVDLAVTNNLQVAYNSGKVYEFLEPETRTLRPFWLYDAILDMKTTEICRSCNGVIRPAGDSWFMNRIPPCHHRCRSTIRSLTAAQAARYGGTRARPPRVRPDAGWGRLAEVDWKPDLRGVDAALVKAYRSRT